MASTLLYALTFIPILLITLTVHEGGHFLAARLLRIKTTCFQIGVGPRLITRYTGKTRIELPQGKEAPEPGQIIHVWVQSATPNGPPADYAAVHWQPVIQRPGRIARALGAPKEPDITPDEFAERRSNAARYNNEYPCLTGQVRSAGEGQFILADSIWAVGLIPAAAMVYLVEDPSNRVGGLFNTVSWGRQTATILAGVGANILLLAAVILVLAISPINRPGQPVMIVEEVQRASPAEAAGILPGDIIVFAGSSLWPSPQELTRAVAEDRAGGNPTILRIQRDGHHLNVHVYSGVDGPIGIAYTQGKIKENEDNALHQRIYRLGETYFSSIATLFRETREQGEPERETPQVSGLIAAAYQTAQAVELAQLKAWLATLGVITMSMAFLNLLPIPPLDGYQLGIRAIQALRKGKPINPKVEHALALSGVTAIVTVAIYLALQDILNLTT